MFEWHMIDTMQLRLLYIENKIKRLKRRHQQSAIYEEISDVKATQYNLIIN